MLRAVILRASTRYEHTILVLCSNAFSMKCRLQSSYADGIHLFTYPFPQLILLLLQLSFPLGFKINTVAYSSSSNTLSSSYLLNTSSIRLPIIEVVMRYKGTMYQTLHFQTVNTIYNKKPSFYNYGNHALFGFVRVQCNVYL